MVFTKSESKKRSKDVSDPLEENRKRTKVHAQRKFAQGSGMNSPIMTPIKEKENGTKSSKTNGASSPAELLPSKRPTTEDFLNFLCFRGTKSLPPRLDFFNEASNSQRTNVSSNPSKQSNSSGIAKLKQKSSSQEYKKRLTDQQSGLQKGNAMRARTASDERQAVRKKAIEKQLRKKVVQKRGKTVRKPHPSILKRIGAARLRGGLRSAGQLPPGSEVGLKTDRKPKRGRPKRQRIMGRKRNNMDSYNPKKRAKIEKELSDNDDDDAEEEEEEEDEDEMENISSEEEVKIRKASPKKTMTMRTRGASSSPAVSPKKQGVSSRPSRKTKEAATIYMEMLTKDLRNPDEEESDDEDFDGSFPELPSTNEEAVKYSALKRGRPGKHNVSKERRSKVMNTLKEASASDLSEEEEDGNEEDEPLLKRSQRIQAIKSVPKKTVGTRGKGRPAKQINVPIATPKKRGVKKREPNLTNSINDVDNDSDISEDSESADKKNDSKTVSRLKNKSIKKTFQKKSIEGVNDRKELNINKKRIIQSTAVSGSDSDEDELNLPSKDILKKFKGSNRNKTNSIMRKGPFKTKLKKSTSPNKKSSGTVMKKQAVKHDSEDSDSEEEAKEVSPRRSSRRKNDSDEEKEDTNKRRPVQRRSKYKDESDTENKSIPKKSKESLQKKGKHKNEHLIEDIKGLRKSDTQNIVNPNSNESDVETGTTQKKNRGSLQRKAKSKDYSDDKHDTKKGSQKSIANTDSDEEENIANKSRELTKKKSKVSTENINNGQKGKLRQQRKSKAKDESDDEESDSKIGNFKEVQRKKSFKLKGNASKSQKDSLHRSSNSSDEISVSRTYKSNFPNADDANSTVVESEEKSGNSNEMSEKANGNVTETPEFESGTLVSSDEKMGKKSKILQTKSKMEIFNIDNNKTEINVMKEKEPLQEISKSSTNESSDEASAEKESAELSTKKIVKEKPFKNKEKISSSFDVNVNETDQKEEKITKERLRPQRRNKQLDESIQDNLPDEPEIEEQIIHRKSNKKLNDKSVRDEDLKTRSMPQRRSKKSYDANEDEKGGGLIKQRKQPSRGSAKSESFYDEENDDDDDDEYNEDISALNKLEKDTNSSVESISTQKEIIEVKTKQDEIMTKTFSQEKGTVVKNEMQGECKQINETQKDLFEKKSMKEKNDSDITECNKDKLDIVIDKIRKGRDSVETTFKDIHKNSKKDIDINSERKSDSKQFSKVKSQQTLAQMSSVKEFSKTIDNKEIEEMARKGKDRTSIKDISESKDFRGSSGISYRNKKVPNVYFNDEQLLFRKEESSGHKHVNESLNLSAIEFVKNTNSRKSMSKLTSNKELFSGKNSGSNSFKMKEFSDNSNNLDKEVCKQKLVFKTDSDKNKERKNIPEIQHFSEPNNSESNEYCKNDEPNKFSNIDHRKSKLLKTNESDTLIDDKRFMRNARRLSLENSENEIRFSRKSVDKLRHVPENIIENDSDLRPFPRVLRKPSLSARAIVIRKEDIEDDDDDDDDDDFKPSSSLKHKSLSNQESGDASGSGSYTECKVILEQLGNITGELSKFKKKVKHSEITSERETHTDEKIESPEEHPVKGSPCSLNSSNSTAETEKLERLEFDQKQKTKQSMGETWRQAFKNAKISKSGHLSPVPQTGVKPFVRQKFPKMISGPFQGKPGDVLDVKAVEVAKPKSNPSLSPFKAMFANQSQRSLSPDPKRHLSPVHKVSFGNESPLRKNEDVKPDYRKQEVPVKSLTQLQYEKKSSDLINSLDSGRLLPSFESIRPYKEIKKEEPKDVSVKAEAFENIPIDSGTHVKAEPIVKVSTEGKHLNLPLAVEHTLRKMSPITVSKKPTLKVTNVPLERKIDNLGISKPVSTNNTLFDKKDDVSHPNLPTGSMPNSSKSCQPPLVTRDLIVRDSSDLGLMSKKKVNMTNEEINRWLNDSTSSGVEHKKDCGIFENNHCECSFRTSRAIMQNSVGVSESVSKEESKIDHGVVEPPVQLKELDKDGKYVAETISTCKVEEYKEKLLSKTSTTEKKMAPPKPRRSSGQDRFKSNKSMTEEEMCEYDFRFDRMSNSPRESVSDVSSVTHRDDVSSSSEYPGKIFHQKRTGSGSKRPSISSPTAFSAENESSVYAFNPDPPPSTGKRIFRRGRGKSGEQEEKQPSSSSIAVQVNMNSNENEAVVECCSTQTERPDDSDSGVLYIKFLPDDEMQIPEGVSVKLDTEGPEKRVIMRAKLVTKPNNAFPPSSSNSRLFPTTARNSSQKPEQKVRPLWTGKAPVGTVQPTLREPQSIEPNTASSQEKSKNLSQSNQSTQISASKGPDSPRGKNSSKSQKHDVPPPNTPLTPIEWKGTEFPSSDIPATLVEAPTFYPSEKEFLDPLEYIEQITPLAQSFGICRIVPPSNFKPECKVSDDMRFTAYNQYVHKMMERWGPNVRELCAIKKYLATHTITLIQLPLIGSMEVDLPRLYQTVQQCGGLKEVIEKKRWARVADAMRIPKSAQDRVTKLDDIYCKFLLPYDTLSHEERTKLLEKVDEEWAEREKRLAAEEDSGNNASGDGSDESSDTDDNIFECITKGKNMPLSVFYRIARNTMATWFKDASPSPSEVEAEFWRHVSEKTCHVCVHCGSIDSGTWGYGFPTTKTSATSRHPWNLKVLTNSPGSILRSLGPVMGITVPTLHVGMLFSSCCWYRDPHALPWIEYLHTGASKIWYGVPDSRASELRKVMYPLLPRHTRDRKVWLPSDTMMVPPHYLLDGGVSLCRVVQEPGQFILVFPKAFTSSISAGYVVSESVYFAQPSWLNTAEQVFKDIQDSCEPPVFSLDKLLFNISNDSRSSAEILIQVLPMIISLIEKEVESRKKLESLGLTSWERLPSHKSGRRKKKEEDQSNPECDTCRGALCLSMVTNSNEDCSYCIDHAIEILSKDNTLLKYCKLMIAYDEEEMEELVDKVKTRIEYKTQKKQKEKGFSGSGSKN